MVIMPLVSGGVLTKLARKFGVNLPDMGAAGGAGAARGGYSGSGHQGGYYGSEGYGREGGGSGGSGIAGTGMNLQNVASSIGGLASLAKMAQSFM